MAAYDVVFTTWICYCFMYIYLSYRSLLQYCDAFFVFIIQQAFFTLARDIKLKMDKKLVSSFSLSNEH